MRHELEEADRVVKRLAAGDAIEDEFDGLVVVCSWPMPAAVQKQYETFQKELTSALPESAYVYPASTLHCTVCTLRGCTLRENGRNCNEGGGGKIVREEG